MPRVAGDDGPVPVIAAAASRADVPVYLDGVGTARALNTVTVKPQVDGKLMSVNFKEGQEVERGDVLAQIDPRTYQAASTRRWPRRRRTRRCSPTPGSTSSATPGSPPPTRSPRQQADTQKALVAQFEAQVQADQAAIDNAKAILGYTTIIAPIDGRTGMRHGRSAATSCAPSDATGIVVITQIAADLGDVHPAAAAARRRSTRRCRQRAAAGRGARRRQQDGRSTPARSRSSTTRSTRPPARSSSRPSSPTRTAALAGAVRQRAAAGRHAASRSWWCRLAAVQRGPNGTFVYVVQAGQQGRHAHRHGRAAGRDAGGDRQRA